VGGSICNSIMKALEGRPICLEPGQRGARPAGAFTLASEGSSSANTVMSSVNLKRHRVVTPNGEGRLFAAAASLLLPLRLVGDTRLLCAYCNLHLCRLSQFGGRPCAVPVSGLI
jgi:hypothetical protein